MRMTTAEQMSDAGRSQLVGDAQGEVFVACAAGVDLVGIHEEIGVTVVGQAILRANLLNASAVLSSNLKFHSLRHTYASLCVAAGLDVLKVSRFMGHSKPGTTLGIYTHLFDTDDHAGAMSALGAIASTQRAKDIPLHG